MLIALFSTPDVRPSRERDQGPGKVMSLTTVILIRMRTADFSAPRYVVVLLYVFIFVSQSTYFSLLVVLLSIVVPEE